MKLFFYGVIFIFSVGIITARESGKVKVSLMSACLSVCPNDNFWAIWPINLIFSM